MAVFLIMLLGTLYALAEIYADQVIDGRDEYIARALRSS